MLMISQLLAIFIAGFGLAYFNGANDVSKGIATLVGSGVTNYRRAVAWGTVWTGIGAGLAALTAGAMLRTFNRVSPATGLHTPSIAIATMSGKILWIAFATFKGLACIHHPCNCRSHYCRGCLQRRPESG
jgi:PiT family inorganic phosphate transporter